MWTSFQALTGLRVAAVDGDVGHVEDVLYDERERRGAFLVVDSRPWWAERVLLIPFDLVQPPPARAAALRVHLQRGRIQHASAADREPPLARDLRARAATAVGWRAAAWGGFVGRTGPPAPRLRPEESASDVVLRSTRDLLGHHVGARDAELGRLRDVVFDPDWRLRALVVDTGGWLFPERVLVAYDASARLRGPTRTIDVGLTRQELAAAPRFEPSLSALELERRVGAAEGFAESSRDRARSARAGRMTRSA